MRNVRPIHDFGRIRIHRPPLECKPVIDSPDAEFEREADVTADAAIQLPCTDSKHNEAQTLQTKRVPAMAGGPGAFPLLSSSASPRTRL